MARIAITLAAGLLILGGCAPQSRVQELENRVLELEDAYNKLARAVGKTGPAGAVSAAKVRAPNDDCQKPGLATWEEDGTLGCTGPKNLNQIDGYDLYFPATKGCLGNYVIMGPESLTCDTPEHPYH